MIDIINSKDSTVEAQVPLHRLKRAIMFSEGEFSLILACCNDVNLQKQIMQCLKQISSIEIQELLLPTAVQTLYTTITTTLENKQPQALMVFGLESVDAINQVITSTNLMRDELRKDFKFPLVLWVNDEILQKLIWLAPDLKNWAANTIRFDIPNHQLIEWAAITA
jgi:hypothetical protein